MLKILHSKSVKTFGIWGLDCENDPETGEFKLGVVWRNEEDYTVYQDPEKLAKYLLKPHGVILTGLNLAYDLNLLHPHFRPKRLERTGKLITCDMSKNTAGKVIHNFKNDGHRSRYIKVVDIGNFIQNKSLKQVAADFGISHLDIHDYRDDRIEAACVSHSRAGVLILRELQKMYNKMGGSLELTGSSTALKLFQRRYLQPEHEIYDVQDPLELETIKRISNLAYYGGRTEIFRREKIKKTVCIDIVSSYPHTMRNNIYPDMNTAIYIEHPNSEFEYDRALENFEGCMTCTVYQKPTHIPILPYKRDGKLTFPTGAFKGTWTFPELRYFIKKGGEIKKVHDVIICKGMTGFFDGFINDMFKYKQQSDTKAAAKLNMNGLSGKFGQKKLEDSSYIEICPGDHFDVEKIYEMDGVAYQYEPSGNIIGFSAKAYPLIVAYVTAYARQNLHEQMENIGFDSVAYTDTDSIIYEDTGQTIINEGSELGQWEIKFKGAWEGRTLKNYRYKEYNKCYWNYVSKGVPGKHQAEFWKNGSVWQVTPVKLRSAIRRNMKLGKWYAIEKYQGEFIDKRVFSSQGKSTAIELNEE